MKLTELFLNRHLYKDTSQNLETKNSEFVAADSTPQEPPPIPSGGAAQDINISNVTINGGQITPGTITLTVGDWGWGQTCVFSSTDLNTVAWTSGSFKTASGTVFTISAGNTDARLTAAGLTSPMNAKVYIYLDLNLSNSVYQCTYTPGTSVGVGKVLVAVAKNGTASATYNLSEATQIVGDNILANTIDASKIVAGSITATQISSSYIYAGYIDADQINVGTLTGFTIRTASSGHRVVMDGSADSVTTYNSSNKRTILIDGAGTSATYSQVSIGGALALYADADIDVAGGSLSEVYSGYAGGWTTTVIHTINNTGSEDAYFFFNSDGVFAVDSINLNGTTRSSWPTSGGDAYIADLGDYLYNGAYLRVSTTGLTVKGSNGLYLSGANIIDFKDWRLTMNANKTAIVPTSEGYNALYCMESPDVWFMDFCDEKGKLDPMFEEVTVGPYRYIKCEDSGYQVWGKRRGHEKFRFESKTEEEFLANEKFLNMNKPNQLVPNPNLTPRPDEEQLG